MSDKSYKASPRILLAATGSNAGKTTVTCALLRALVSRGVNVHSFKCGPDYIDPMFHRRIVGSGASNLDIFMNGEATVKYLLAKNSEGKDFAVIEGVMGLYDGSSFESDIGSANHLSMLTNTPCVLIVNVRGMSLSLCALVKGFLDYLPNKISGVILNSCTAGMYPVYEKMLSSQLGVKCYGYLPNLPQASLGSRHLGLVTADEVNDLNTRLDILAAAAEECLDIDGLLELGAFAGELVSAELWGDPISPCVTIGVARDKAFCFLYEENLSILEHFGCRIRYFSPLDEPLLPDDIDGMLLPGGYPELYGERLSKNETMKQSILAAQADGMPIYAECGGFMYLLSSLVDAEGRSHQMVGLLSGESSMGSALTRFGYLKLCAESDNLLCEKGGVLRAHEFHYSDSDANGSDFLAEKGSRQWRCIHADETLFAGYPHINFAAYPNAVARFVGYCQKYQNKKGKK